MSNHKKTIHYKCLKIRRYILFTDILITTKHEITTKVIQAITNIIKASQNKIKTEILNTYIINNTKTK